MAVYSASSYHDSGIERALKQLKYRGSRDIADALAMILVKGLPKGQQGYPKGSPFLVPKDYPLGNPYAEIVAVPITTARRRERGFNQAELLGRALAKKMDLPFSDALEKIHETPPQSTLGRNERLKNLHGAFRARADYRPKKTVIIVDDISTTGATLLEAARALTEKGPPNGEASAPTIIGAVVAKA